MSYYCKYRQKTKDLYPHQKEFVRQTLMAKRDGKRLSIRLPLVIEEYLEKEKSVADLTIKLLAEHFAKTRTIYDGWTNEQLQAELEGM